MIAQDNIISLSNNSKHNYLNDFTLLTERKVCLFSEIIRLLLTATANFFHW